MKNTILMMTATMALMLEWSLHAQRRTVSLTLELPALGWRRTEDSQVFVFADIGFAIHA